MLACTAAAATGCAWEGAVQVKWIKTVDAAAGSCTEPGRQAHQSNLVPPVLAASTAFQFSACRLDFGWKVLGTELCTSLHVTPVLGQILVQTVLLCLLLQQRDLHAMFCWLCLVASSCPASCT